MQVLELIFQRDTKRNLSCALSFQLGFIKSKGEESRCMYLTRWYNVSDEEIKQTQPSIADKSQELLAKPRSSLCKIREHRRGAVH